MDATYYYYQYLFILLIRLQTLLNIPSALPMSPISLLSLARFRSRGEWAWKRCTSGERRKQYTGPDQGPHPRRGSHCNMCLYVRNLIKSRYSIKTLLNIGTTATSTVLEWNQKLKCRTILTQPTVPGCGYNKNAKSKKNIRNPPGAGPKFEGRVQSEVTRVHYFWLVKR